MCVRGLAVKSNVLMAGLIIMSCRSVPIACCLSVQVLVATGKGNLAYLEVDNGKLKQVAHRQLEVEVACVDITPIG